MDQDMKIKILRNTITVFNRKGLKLTMDDIAEQMGIWVDGKKMNCANECRTLFPMGTK